MTYFTVHLQLRLHLQMAKSIRSKHRRRMRSVKRDKFAKKDLVKLKATLMRDDVLNNLGANSEMADIATGNVSSTPFKKIPIAPNCTMLALLMPVSSSL